MSVILCTAATFAKKNSCLVAGIISFDTAGLPLLIFRIYCPKILTLISVTLSHINDAASSKLQWRTWSCYQQINEHTPLCKLLVSVNYFSFWSRWCCFKSIHRLLPRIIGWKPKTGTRAYGVSKLTWWKNCFPKHHVSKSLVDNALYCIRWSVEWRKSN